MSKLEGRLDNFMARFKSKYFLFCILLVLQWPFVRFLGVQEPASVIFSMLNLATHLYGFSIFYQQVPKDYPYLWIVHLCPLVLHIAVFHDMH